MTSSKSVDKYYYRFTTAKPFVVTNRTYSLIDGVEFVIYTIAPDLLPFSQTVVRDTRNEVTTRKFHACDGQRKSRLSCGVSSFVTRNVDMAWNPAQNNTFSRVRKSSIILQVSKIKLTIQLLRSLNSSMSDTATAKALLSHDLATLTQ